MSVSNPSMPLTAAQPRDRLIRMLRAAGIGSLAGLLSGVVWGILARGAMRVIAQAMNHFPSFSIEGTLMILIVGALFGSLIGLLYGLLRVVLPARRMLKGLILIGLMEATIGLLIAIGPIIQEGNRTVAPLALALFGSSIVIWGALIEALFQPLNARILAGSQSRLRTAITSAALCVPALILVLMIAAQQLGLLGE